MEPVEIVPFSRGIDRSGFSCGKPDLDDWLLRRAGQQERSYNTRTFLAIHPSDNDVVGYYATTAYRLDLDEASRAYGVGKRQYPVPAVLLARLAVDRRFAGRGVGRQLLVHALEGCAEASAHVGFEVVVVHAIDDEAVTFYARYGFSRFADHPLHLHADEDLAGDAQSAVIDSYFLCTYQGCTFRVCHSWRWEDHMTAKSERLNLRCSTEALELLREAASLQNQDLTSFVLGASIDRARTVLTADRALKLTPAEILQLERALDVDEIPIPQLAALVRSVRGVQRT